MKQKIKELVGYSEADINETENKAFGDYSTNVALKLAKQEGKNPRETAEQVKKEIEAKPEVKEMFSKIEIAGPGFINFTLSPEFLDKQVSDILEGQENFGRAQKKKYKQVSIEFISANPTGPLTLGNGRGGFYGDVLANVMEAAGFDVKREYYVNDAGYQVEVLGHSILKDEKAQYKGDYVDLLSKKLTGFLKSKDPKVIGAKAAEYILEKMLKPTIGERMKIRFDEWSSERKLRKSGATEKVLEILKQKNLTYEKEGAIWFKSTEFGDDKDRVLITSGNEERGQEATYLLPDIAYHFKKFVEDRTDVAIDIWGADHHGYMARLQAAKKALEMPGKLEFVIMQLVRLFSGGQEVKMSKRAGTYITLDELLSEIPLDVARFFFLMRSPNTHMDFDLDLAKEQSEKNPVYYIQYAYARICAILRKAKEQGIEAGENSKLEEQPEKDLAKELLKLPDIIEESAADYQVHRLPQYALDLVRVFHKFYETCRVLDENNPKKTQSRLALIRATQVVLKNSLGLMGISAPEKM